MNNIAQKPVHDLMLSAASGGMAPAPIGHNRPPVSDFYRETNETLPGYLEAENTDLLKRRDELAAAFARAPAEVADDVTAGKMSDFIKQVSACIKSVESKRTADKEPTLQAGRVIDGFYKQISDPLAAIKTKLNDRVTIYLRKKEAEERRRREEQERIARAEAERQRIAAEEAARNAKTDTDLSDAIARDESARQAEADAFAARQDAEAKAAELSRTRGSLGAVASLRTTWACEILSRDDLDLNALRPYFTTADLEKALRAAVKAGARSIKGARIFETDKAAVH
jgi:hypothetical protein